MNMQDNYLALNLTGSNNVSAGIWGGEPTSSQFYVSSSIAGAGDFVAYLWAEVAGFSKIGSYTGNGKADGPFVYCGFKPRWVMVKQASSTNSNSRWWIFDSARQAFNASNPYVLMADQSSPDIPGNAGDFDLLSNGFKVRLADSNGVTNTASQTYIFAAFAEAPFKYATAR
jgi:hypothetical protein